MFNPSLYGNSRPDGFPVLEVVSPREQAARLFVPLKRSRLEGDIAGPLAALALTQVFGYTAEQCNGVIEAVYHFPLPGDAAVRRVSVHFGEVAIEAELRERGQAESEYKQAQAEGKQTVLTTRESASVFTLHVSGIRPGEDVTVRIEFAQCARAEKRAGACAYL